jgi:hypothetical protein
LGLSTPELVGRHFHDAEAIGFRSHVGHLLPPQLMSAVAGGE